MKKPAKGTWGLLLIALLILAVLAPIQAMFDPEKTARVNPDEIEDKTLAIGTHLIYLGSLSQQLYDVAEQSALDSNQTSIYYKSELGDGLWYDITSGSTIKDISFGGRPVDSAIIAELMFTHHTKSDGITYDLVNGGTVNLFDLVDPYDLSAMEELEPLRLYHEIVTSGAPEDSDEEDEEEEEDTPAVRANKIAYMEEVLLNAYKNDETGALDTILENMQAYHDELKNNFGTEEQLQAILDVMETVDAQRRIIVYNLVNEAIDGVMVAIASLDDKEAGRYDDLNTPFQDSVNNLNTSIDTAEAKLLNAGSGIVGATRLALAEEMIARLGIAGRDSALCRQAVDDYLALDYISKGEIVEREKELLLLENTLLNLGEEQYKTGLAAGETDEYKAALALNAAKAALKTIRDKQKTIVTMYANEFQFFIDARCQRLTNEAAIAYIQGEIVRIGIFYQAVREDGYFDTYTESVDEHLEWLSTKLAELLAAGGSELDDLRDQLNSLRDEMLQALADNDLLGAADLEGQINALNAELNELKGGLEGELAEKQAELAAVNDALADNPGDGALLAQKAALLTDIAGLEAKLGDESLADRINTIKKEALGAVKNPDGDDAGLAGNVAALVDILEENFKLGFPALKEVLDAMAKERDVNGNNDFDDLIAELEDAILNNKSAYDIAMQGEADLDKIREDIADFFAELDAAGRGVLDMVEDVITMAALDMLYTDLAGRDLGNMLDDLGERGNLLGNPLVFYRLRSPVDRYAAISALAYQTRLRYVWEGNKQIGTLGRAATAYIYKNGSQKVTKNGQEIEMAAPAQFLNQLYLPAMYVEAEFGLMTIDLGDTNYTVLVSPAQLALAEELYARF